MRNFKIIAALAIALPTMALAQVGPNPAAPGGSQDPSTGAARDTMTAPMGNSPSMSTRTNAGMMNSGSAGMSGTSDTTTTTGSTTGTSDTSTGTSVTGTTATSPDGATGTSATTGAKSGKKSGMSKSRQPR